MILALANKLISTTELMWHCQDDGCSVLCSLIYSKVNCLQLKNWNRQSTCPNPWEHSLIMFPLYGYYCTVCTVQYTWQCPTHACVMNGNVHAKIRSDFLYTYFYAHTVVTFCKIGQFLPILKLYLKYFIPIRKATIFAHRHKTSTIFLKDKNGNLSYGSRSDPINSNCILTDSATFFWTMHQISVYSDGGCLQRNKHSMRI